MSPLEYQWKAGAWHPMPYARKQAEHDFGEGEIARLERCEERSSPSHRQFFAYVNEVYENLPEAYEGRWPTADDMRRWLLTWSKFCTRQEFACASHAEAERWFRNLAGKYHRIELEGNTVIGYTAHSQDYATMGRRTFQESRDAVEAACARILGISGLSEAMK
jgi:hypothetical protein